MTGARKPKQAFVDALPVMALIAGNRRNGPSTSTPAQAAAFGPFIAFFSSFWVKPKGTPRFEE
ncbi:hypothetical protein ACG2F4_11690 [Halalkalibaculum sp. DA3122]